jgi:hypothetical protein
LKSSEERIKDEQKRRKEARKIKGMNESYKMTRKKQSSNSGLPHSNMAGPYQRPKP